MFYVEICLLYFLNLCVTMSISPSLLYLLKRKLGVETRLMNIYCLTTYNSNLNDSFKL